MVFCALTAGPPSRACPTFAPYRHELQSVMSCATAHMSQDINPRPLYHDCCKQPIMSTWRRMAPYWPHHAMLEGGMARKRRKGLPRGDPAGRPVPRQPGRSFRPREGDREKAEEYVTLGANCQRRGKNNQAMTFYDKAIEADPSCINAYSNKGTVLAMSEKPTEALACLEKAMKLVSAAVPDKDHILVYTNLAGVLNMLGRHNEAVTCLDMALTCLDKTGPDKDAREMVAYLFEAIGEEDKAAACRRADGGLAWKYHKEGMRLAEQGRDAEAAASFDRAIREDPSFAEAHYSKGTMMRHLGRSDDALACFRQAAKVNPDFALAYNDIAVELNHVGRNDEALETVETALRKDPELGFAMFYKGVILASLKQHREAIVWFDRAANKDPDVAVIHLNKGASHRALGENREALQCFNRAIKLDPSDMEALQARSEVEEALGADSSRSWWDRVHDRR